MTSVSLVSQFKASSIRGDVVPGVSVITAGVEAKGHGIYTDGKTLSTLLSVATKFPGGVKVKLEHGTGVADIIGSIRAFRIDGAQLRGDLHLLPSSKHYAHVRQIIEAMPEAVGLSIHFSFTKEKIGERDYVRIEDLWSIDLVDRPAANPGGLFSATPPPETFESKVQVLRESGMSAADAVRKVVAEHWDLHAAYIRKGGGPFRSAPASKPFPEIVKAQMCAGKSKAEAVAYCVREFPDAYHQWRQSGSTATL